MSSRFSIPMLISTLALAGGCTKEEMAATKSAAPRIASVGNIEGVVTADLPTEGLVTFHAGKSYMDAPLSQPDGIAIQLIAGSPVATDVAGMTLYTLEKDAAAVVVEKWQPATAADGAQARGDWSIVKGPNGSQQWAYQGDALYTYKEDSVPGDANGDAQLATAILASARQTADAPIARTGGKAAVLTPTSGVAAPAGIQLREILDAGGVGLADANGKTLYLKQGNKEEAECTANCEWLTLRAPADAKAVGKFAAVKRPIGIQQWAYDGKLLYTFVGDEQPGDARGATIDGQWRVALLERLFFPADVEIRNVLGVGTVLALNGKTLYQRDFYYGQFGGRTLRRGFRITAESGRKVGTRGCDAACEREWIPFLAPEDVQAAGHWAAVKRADGKKQWSYKGFALYTYTGDERAGEVNGNDRVDIYDLASAKPGPYAELLKEQFAIEPVAFKSPAPLNLTSAMQWHVSYP